MHAPDEAERGERDEGEAEQAGAECEVERGDRQGSTVVQRDKLVELVGKIGGSKSLVLELRNDGQLRGPCVVSEASARSGIPRTWLTLKKTNPVCPIMASDHMSTSIARGPLSGRGAAAARSKVGKKAK